ncbi:3-hydroxyacyl-CoA dehydrogenase NAD-binding domain-containing protein [Legionella anisa]|uniref:enoyl-CoA hydratase n=1 Tax=Legionella anisa TaxID=28082 RepID=A0AAX0WV39_9GAMM|nr:3-hydroxyacyl-CoA dehydrogenase NAD-binding domain-containing protein [Legionella anisa]AWN74193.1 crotonase [Legionella anisa]KTC72144.1 enoyl CoA hydratase [Legionella anisa]MBN5934367.1 enoyl-CoA hydratase/isomerase family protein [Legionella anisa]MCW8425776.1 3-hydroxyacyl-CoA dehydrogenase NAD-binding domain-containing protein [Legionella anisa]MCW8448794.1 3-hydroxyacyl-CoA dehydrogenase NAD-binding domain-containing protein [Legionella anisa]
MNNYKHWDLKRDSDNILWLGLDRKDTSINSINEEVLDELNSLLHEISQDKNALGLIVHSAKEKGFIAGADVNAFSKFETPAQAVDFLRKGQAVFARLQALTIPSVAMIDGFCMGGGYELALACTYRVASDEKDTRIGLPEVMLGIHPGWGGSVRLPQLIGGFNALSQIILTGNAVHSAKAKSLGMVDEVVPVRQLKRAAVYFIKNKPPKHKPSFVQGLTNSAWLRKPIAALMRHNIAKRVRKEHYPAPYAIVDLWEKEGGVGDRAYLKEIDSVEHLVSTGITSKNLIRAFTLRERLKGFAKGSDFKANHVHVIGAGIMGGDIAAWCALRGLRVTLQDQSYTQIAPAIGRAHALYKKKLRKPRLIQAAMDNLIPDPEGHGIARADVIIEAVFENLAVKQEIMKKVEKLAKKDAIIATNTSSIPLDEISSVMNNPNRLVGIHFFNPVAKMDLVEVVSSTQTSKKIELNSCAFVNQIGKLPLPVKSSPGFLVNRVLMPYLMECVQLLDEGYSAETIDEAALSFGMFMGPVELADTVGLDVGLAVAENLTGHFGGTVPQKLRDMVKEGKLGRKTGQGLYQYKNGKPIKKQPSTPIPPHIADRLILRMVNESAACLREGVVADADLLDAGMIFGTGFAPFRGGPMNYAKDFGTNNLENLFKTLESKYGERFKVDESF